MQIFYNFILPFFAIFTLSVFVNKSIAQTKASSQLKYTYKIINSNQNTFGYEILDHGHPLIHQPGIPSLSGNVGFALKADAVKVAKLVIKKLNHNIMPPSVNMHELDSLHINLNNTKYNK